MGRMNTSPSRKEKDRRSRWWRASPFPPVILAPMAGITDSPYRILCMEHGASGTVSEMVSVEGLVRNNSNTWDMLRGIEGEAHCSIQFFGSNPPVFPDALEQIIERGHTPAAIDINMGCPVPKVVRSGAGAALMKDPATAVAIVAGLDRYLRKRGLRIPLWVKIRSGWDADSINAPALSAALEEAGADGITVHARTRAAFYSGEADWDVIAGVVDTVSVPVLGNGDVLAGADAARMLQSTGCAGVMVGRGALGRPWIFGEIGATLAGESPPEEPTPGRRIALLLGHLEMEEELRGSEGAARFMRKHVHWYTRGLPDSASLREEANRRGTAGDLGELLVRYAESLGFEVISRYAGGA